MKISKLKVGGGSVGVCLLVINYSFINSKGFPVAFLFSNKIDEITMDIYFKAIKKRVPKITTEIFMSDDYPAYSNSWIGVFGPVKHKLLCAWHVLHSWNKHYNRIKCPVKRHKTKFIMRNLLKELDEVKFEQQFTYQIGQLKSDKDTNSFGIYIESYYSNRKEMWAYCYRKGFGINTNMHLESMHR